MTDPALEQPGQPQPRTLLRRHAALILTTTLLVTGGAYAYAAVQQPTYTAKARVLVQAYTLPTTAGAAPDMGTEQAIATSGAVLANVAGALDLSVDAVRSAEDVSASPTADILDFSFSSSNQATASRGATIAAAAYMQYRTAQSSTSSQQTNVTQTLATPKVTTQLITSATRPGSPSSPDFIIDVLAGLLVGLLVGIAAAFVADRFTQRLRTANRWQEATGVAVLAGLRRDTMVDDSENSRTGDRSSMVLRYLRVRVSQLVRRGGAVVLVTEVREQPERPAIARFLTAALATTGWSAALIELTRDVSEPSPRKTGDDANGAVAPTSVPTELRVRVSATSGSGLALRPAGEWQPTTVDELMRLIERRRAANDVVVVTGPPISTSVTTLDVAAVSDVAVILDNVASARRDEALRVIAEIRATGCQVGGGVLLGLSAARTGDAAAAPVVAPAQSPRSTSAGPDAGSDPKLRLRTVVAPLITWTEADEHAAAVRSSNNNNNHVDGSPR